MSLLNTPLFSGRLQIKNRLVFPPIGTHSANADGSVSDKTLAHYGKISRCGAGLVFIEHSFVNISGKAYPGQLSAASDDMITGLARLASVVRRSGAAVFLQLNHCGSLSVSAAAPPVSASAVIAPKGSQMPREMTAREIEELIADFAKAALRAKRAGFDGVEIHAAHSYLLNQFFSPLTNKRRDEYGGDLPSRTRLMTDTVRAVRAAVGTELPISIRFGACDYMDGGTSLSDSLCAARELEAAGADIISVTGGLCQFLLPELMHRQGYFSELSREIKKVVSVPIILTGGVTQPESAELLLQNEDADLVGVGRAILKDPDCLARSLSPNAADL